MTEDNQLWRVDEEFTFKHGIGVIPTNDCYLLFAGLDCRQSLLLLSFRNSQRKRPMSKSAQSCKSSPTGLKEMREIVKQ